MKIAVVGVGSAGTRHARNLQELGHDVVAFDPAGKRVDGVEVAGSLESAIEESQAAIVASPTALHAEQAVAALERGRSVLVEKPLAVTVAEAQNVEAAARRAGVVCGVAMNLRFHPGILELKRLLDSGELGTLRYVRASFGYDLRLWHPDEDYRGGYSARADLGGGIVLDAIHELDYLLWLVGPVSSVSAETAHVSDLEIDVEDLAVAAFRFKSGVVGSVDLNFVEPAYRRSCLVVGSDAVASWDWQSATVTVRRGASTDCVVEVRRDLADTYREELVDFLDAVSRGGTPRASAHDGVEAVRLAQAVKDSARSGKRVSLDG